jgi:hypothetical protein
MHADKLTKGEWEPEREGKKWIADQICDSGCYPNTTTSNWYQTWQRRIQENVARRKRENEGNDHRIELGEAKYGKTTDFEFRVDATQDSSCFSREEDFPEIGDFDASRRIIEQNIVKDSHPGYPWHKLGHNNGAVLKGHSDLIWGEVVKRLKLILMYGDAIFEMSPEELAKNGICDVVKVFIKWEPHSTKKIVTGNLRIIAAVSLVDQIVTRLNASRQNNAEIETWETCPSSSGMGLHDAGLAVIWEVASVFDNKGILCETDVSGWDWSVQAWELMLDAEIRTRLAGMTPTSSFGFFSRVHAHVVANSVFVMPDGEMLAQTLSGGQLSGCYNTSSTNSRCRVIATLASRWLANYLVKLPMLGIKVMGDDSFEMWFQGLVEGLQKIGHSIKMCNVRENMKGFEFCSQIFVGRGVAYPVDFSKTLFRFLSHNPADPKYPEYRAQLLHYMRHLPTDILQKVESISSARVERAQNYSGSL